jgi:hypothetical protein
MGDPLQIMVLPTAVSEGPPQVLLDDGGIWRDTVALPVFAPQTKLRADIEAYLSGVMKQVGQVPPIPVPPQGIGFRTRFASLMQNLLPPEVRAALQQATAVAGPRPQLNIFFRTGAEWIPWELLHDGTDFLGLRFAVARYPIVLQATQMRGARARVVKQVYSLLARDVLQDAVLANWEGTFDGIAPSPAWQRRYPNGAGIYPTLQQLDDARNADVVHVTCHGGLKDGMNEYYWTLDHQNPQYFDYRITTSIAQSAGLAARPLVFGNACASAGLGGADLGAMQGFGASFMVGGALNFIGTFAPVTKTMAIVFARRFYERLFGFGGNPVLPIAEALRATKQSFADEGTTDPSYLFYCLYGPSDSTYKPG